MPPNTQQRTMTLRDFLEVVFRRKVVITTLFLSITGTVAVGSFLQPPVYQASSSILVPQDQRKLVLTPTLSLVQDTQIQSEVELIKGRPVAEDVASDFAPLELTPEQVQETMDVEAIKDTRLIKISYESNDPILAARIVDSIVDNYLRYRLKIYEDIGEYNFFDKQLEITRERLNGLEQSLGAFKSKQGLTSPERHEAILLQRLEGFQQALTDVQTRTIRKQTELNAIRDQIKKGYQTIIPPSGRTDETGRWNFIGVLKNKLLTLELKENELLQDYTPEHGLVANVQEEIRLTRQKLQTEVEQIVSLEESSLKALKEEEMVLESKVNEVSRQIRELLRDQSEMTRLARGLDDNAEIYSMLLKKREEARIERQGTVDIPDVKIVNHASVPSRPVKPKKARNISFAVVLSLALGFGLALFLEYLDHSLKTAQDVEYYLGLPVLASIPEQKT